MLGIPSPAGRLSAFRENNESSFRRAAESIISDELAANHHEFGRELQRALGPVRNGTGQSTGLRGLSKDRRVEELLFFPKPLTDPTRLLVEGDTERQLCRVIDEQSNRLKLAEHGYRPKARLLFWGPPGCGKTMTAHYLSIRLGLPLAVLQISSAISSFLGETASRIQQAFDAANQSPMMLFLDEVDAIAKDRDDEHDVGELKRVVNSLLQALDSFRDGKSILVAASNHQYLLDSAVWRRFDTVIRFPLPSEKAREEFMRQLLSGVRVVGSLTPAAKASHRLSYADVERAVTEAVKTMILTGRDELRGGDVAEEVKLVRKQMSQARKRLPRTPRDT